LFIGHFAVGFAAKRVLPQASLATLFAAVQLADTLWPVFVATGLEHVRIAPGDTPFTPLEFVSYPYSHSLLMLVGWGLGFGFIYTTLRRATRRELLVMTALVVSHWALDFFSHRPDLPLVPGGTGHALTSVSPAARASRSTRRDCCPPRRQPAWHRPRTRAGCS